MESARRARAADAARLWDLAAMARAELAPVRGGALYLLRDARPPELDLDLTIDVDDRFTIAGCIDEVVVGYLSVRTETLTDGAVLARVDDLYVEPDARGVGVGEAMMHMALGWCEAKGCAGIDAVALPGDRATKNFFERFGLTARAIVVHRPLGPGAP